MPRTEGVPLVYRRQAMREIDAAEVDELPAGPCRTWAVLRGQAPSTTGSEAAPGHAGLGLDRYAQCTSPIRRYGDLAIHHQIKAALRGEIPPFLDGELLTLSTPKRAPARASSSARRTRGGSPSSSAAAPASRSRAVVLGAHMDSRRSEVKVLLPELGAIVDHKSARDLKPGDEISLAPDRRARSCRHRTDLFRPNFKQTADEAQRHLEAAEPGEARRRGRRVPTRCGLFAAPYRAAVAVPRGPRRGRAPTTRVAATYANWSAAKSSRTTRRAELYRRRRRASVTRARRGRRGRCRRRWSGSSGRRAASPHASSAGTSAAA